MGISSQLSVHQQPGVSLTLAKVKGRSINTAEIGEPYKSRFLVFPSIYQLITLLPPFLGWELLVSFLWPSSLSLNRLACSLAEGSRRAVWELPPVGLWVWPQGEGYRTPVFPGDEPVGTSLGPDLFTGVSTQLWLQAVPTGVVKG